MRQRRAAQLSRSTKRGDLPPRIQHTFMAWRVQELHTCTFTPNVVVEWLTLLLRIREVPGSNIRPADWGCGFPQSLQVDIGIVL